jgi:membrane protease YdiL (CAAX protease family)
VVLLFKDKILYMKQKEFITSVIFFILLVCVFALFPTNNNFQNILSMIFFLIILPILYIKVILKKNLSEFGIRVGNYKNGLIYGFSGIVSFILLFIVVIKYTKFLSYYSLPAYVVNSFSFFLVYELFLVSIAVIVYGFFFNGFVYFICEPFFKKWSIIIQSMLFLILVLLIGTSKWSFLPYLIFSLFAGIIVFKSRSIFYALVAQFLVIILLDTYIIYLLR